MGEIFRNSIHAQLNLPPNNACKLSGWRRGGREAGKPLGTGVFRQFSLAGNRVAALHLATCVFLVGNYIKATG